MTLNKDDVITAFHGTFRDVIELPDGLEEQWLLTALAKYALDIEPLEYDIETGDFGDDVTYPVIMTLAYMMKVEYCEREVSRVNKINNIITTDLTLNGNGDTKKYVAAELQDARTIVADYINKAKTSWYAN